MEPHYRRDVWELLLKVRRYRAVFMSTDDLSEADVLGDRIAVLNHGKLSCVGSPDFFKGLYKMGYKVGTHSPVLEA